MLLHDDSNGKTRAMTSRHTPKKNAAHKKLPARNLDFFIKKSIPFLKKLIDLGYFSFEVGGLENLPTRGKVIYAPNHSGWFTLDSWFFTMAILEKLPPQRIPYAVIADVILKVPGLRQIFQDLGVIPSSWLRGLNGFPKGVNSIGIYPEGSDGNCKPFWRAYQMGPWHSGLIRLAIKLKAKIVPVAIIGGEECCPVAWGIKSFKKIIGSKIPVPLSVIPLPTAWKVVFLKPVDFSRHNPALAQDHDRCRNLASQIQSKVQWVLDRETLDRPLAKFSSIVNLLSPRKRSLGD